MSLVADNLLTRLGEQPVLGVSMSGVSLLRLDLQDQLAPGNKRYKLQENLHAAQARAFLRGSDRSSRNAPTSP